MSQSTSVNSIQAALQTDIERIPSVLYNLRSFELPLTNLEINQGFGPNLDIFSVNQSQANQQAGVSTNLLQSNVVNYPFLLMGIGIYALGEDITFSVPGAGVAPASSPTTAPDFDGVVPPTGITADVDAVPAVLEWGGPAWRAIACFMQAYRCRMQLGGQFVLFDELAGDMGIVKSAAEWSGLSSSQTPIANYVRRVNNRVREMELASPLNKLFVPQNQVGGEVATAIPPILSGVSYGAPSIQGVSNTFYKMPRSVLLTPGMPIQLQLTRVQNDDFFYTRLTEELGFQGSVDLPNPVTLDANWTANTTNAIADTSVLNYKGGLLRIGIALKGFALTPSAILDWFQSYGGYFGDIYGVVASTGVAGLQPHQIQQALSAGKARSAGQ